MRLLRIGARCKGSMAQTMARAAARERASSVLTRLAHVMLGVEREAKLVYEIKLGFEEVDTSTICTPG